MLVGLVAIVLAQMPQDPTAPGVITRVDAPRDAVIAAVIDATSTPAEYTKNLPFVRYMWVHGAHDHVAADLGDLGAATLAVNLALNHSAVLIQPKTYRIRTSFVMRLDLLEFAGYNVKIANELVRVWELLKDFEPYFHDFKKGTITENRLVDCEPYVYKGYTYTQKYVNFTHNLAIHAGGLGPALLLSDLTQSNVPIVRWDWWMVLALTTRDLGYSVGVNGFYYDFRIVKGLNINQYLAQVGADAKLSADFSADRAALILESKVTFKPRKIVFLRSLVSAVGAGPGLVTITQDLSDVQTNDDKNDPFKNVLKHEFAASEVFREMACGLIESSLFNAAGVLQDTAPDAVVHDNYATPKTYGTKVLHGGIACCGRCHVSESSSWYQPIANDIVSLVAKGGVDIIGDFLGKDKIKADSLARIIALYRWQPELRVLPEARDYYFDAVFQLCSRHFPKEENVVKAVWARLSSVYTFYYTGMVSPVLALREIGYDVPEKQAPYIIRRVFVDTTKRADPVLGFLSANRPVHRWQFNTAFAGVAAADTLAPIQPNWQQASAMPKDMPQPGVAIPADSIAPLAKKQPEKTPRQQPIPDNKPAFQELPKPKPKNVRVPVLPVAPEAEPPMPEQAPAATPSPKIPPLPDELKQEEQLPKISPKIGIMVPKDPVTLADAGQAGPPKRPPMIVSEPANPKSAPVPQQPPNNEPSQQPNRIIGGLPNQTAPVPQHIAPPNQTTISVPRPENVEPWPSDAQFQSRRQNGHEAILWLINLPPDAALHWRDVDGWVQLSGRGPFRIPMTLRGNRIANAEYGMLVVRNGQVWKRRELKLEAGYNYVCDMLQWQSQ